jgi:trans-aconitate methyltransferase
MTPSTRRSYFTDMYATGPDPWGFESRWYERRKYGVTVAALPEPRYASAFEPGCSVGVLTALLAERCERLLATDIVPAALERAAGRLREASNVTLEDRAVPEDWPPGPFDLVVLSEIAYYFDARTLDRLVRSVVDTTLPGATIVAVHWRPPTDYPLSGDAAHAVIDAAPQLVRQARHLEESFVLEVWRRAG